MNNETKIRIVLDGLRGEDSGDENSLSPLPHAVRSKFVSSLSPKYMVDFDLILFEEQ